MAYGKTRWLFFLGCIGAFLMGLSFIIGVHFDIKTLVYLYFFANLINSLPAFISLKNILKFSYIELVNVFFRTISPAFLMFLLIKAWQHFSFFKNASIDFSFNVALGIFSYIVFYTLFNFNEVMRTGVIHKLRCMTKLK